MVNRKMFTRVSVGLAAAAVAALTVLAPQASAAQAGTTQANTAPASNARQAAVQQALKVTPNVADSGCTGRALPLDCWVHEPIVTQPSATYPTIQFLPGDHVTVDAGGCVQTGGHGATWKRYVNPASDNGLYHGLINIPGGTAGTQQIWTAVGRTFTVGGSGGSLVLGYEDDGYSDNGYYSHDDGTGNQCKGVGNAWVHIVIS
ncbi:hypothetical protein [Kutzneria sp. 744]|uniref:hypothetical protein n=1 Tax=Kutzneria sp. (strain 744) TaxID=345341 RepID=UPI0003EEAB2B|nr:hypothetical protein [Kutzneria sp. 744]EWM11270.1 hypothetical protein KUTG_01574 [Kutzneria sp. 744]